MKIYLTIPKQCNQLELAENIFFFLFYPCDGTCYQNIVFAIPFSSNDVQFYEI